MFLNILGYYGVFLGLKYRNDHVKIRQLDAGNYSEAEAVMFKIPIAIPYAPDADDFERVDGQFVHEGHYYRMIKKKLAKDTLYVVCVKDTEQKRIHEALSDYVKTFTDQPGTGHPSGKAVVAFIKDYLITEFAICPTACGWSADIIRYGATKSFVDSFSSSLLHPPQLF